jgi:hypothetical protein
MLPSSAVNTLPHKMISHLNVLAALMEDSVLHQCESRLVVHSQFHWLDLLPPKISEKPCQPETLHCCRSRGDILCLARRHCNNALLEEFQLTRLEPRKNTLEVLWLVSTSLA